MLHGMPSWYVEVVWRLYPNATGDFKSVTGDVGAIRRGEQEDRSCSVLNSTRTTEGNVLHCSNASSGNAQGHFLVIDLNEVILALILSQTCIHPT